MSKAGIWSREDAMERFLRKYSNGFPDAWYRSSHRDARLAQTKLWHELFPGTTLRELASDKPHIAAQHILRVLELREKPLLHLKNELPRVRAAFMRTEKMTTFIITLADILDAQRPNEAQYNAYLAAFNALEFPPKKTPMTWPIISSLPFIAQPEKHMFVKPTATRTAASGLGFELQLQGGAELEDLRARPGVQRRPAEVHQAAQRRGHDRRPGVHYGDRRGLRLQTLNLVKSAVRVEVFHDFKCSGPTVGRDPRDRGHRQPSRTTSRPNRRPS